jgi:cytosine/adenosine deaminase-related metal-dependent hydrolase
MRFSLQARVVFPVDRSPIENGIVIIDGERIVAVGTKADGGEVIDLGSVALLPGLVNAHTHLEFSHLQRPLGRPGMRLVDWIRLVIAERGRGDRAPGQLLERGRSESIRCGVTTLGDITTGVPGCLPGWDVTAFAEVIGFSRARTDSVMHNLVDRLRFMDQAFGKLKNFEAVLPQFGISPHAPYTISQDLLVRLIELARERDLPVAMHVAESIDELELLDAGSGPFRELLEERSMWDADALPRGSRPLDYLRKLAEAPRGLVVHGNYLDDDELEFLGKSRETMSLVYCPRTHAFFRHTPYPLAKALKVGARVVLATDSRASNPDLDLLSEMRHVVSTFPALEPQQVLRMGTFDAAEALGRDGDVGSVASGKVANLVAIPIADDARANPNDILAEIFASETAPSSVFLAGRPLNA